MKFVMWTYFGQFSRFVLHIYNHKIFEMVDTRTKLKITFTTLKFKKYNNLVTF